MPAHTADELLESVKVRACTPTRQSTITDAEILRIATEELVGFILPAIRQARSGYFQYAKDFSLSGVSNGFAIPSRAAGNIITRALLISDTGATAEVPFATEGDYDTLPYSTSNQGVYQNAVYYIRNNKVYLNPYPLSGASTLRVIYPLRPGNLVLTTSARQILSHTSTSITLTSSLGTLSTGTAFDIISNGSPYVYHATDQTGTVAGDTISGISVPTDVADGDWVVIAGESPVPQIPYELHPVLRARTVCGVLESQGYMNELPAAENTANRLLSQLLGTVTPRAEGQTQKIINVNPFVENDNWWR